MLTDGASVVSALGARAAPGRRAVRRFCRPDPEPRRRAATARGTGQVEDEFRSVELPGGKQGGYSLGRHDSEAAAQNALDAFRERGLRNARVAQVRESGSPRTWLRLDNLRGAAADAVRALPAAQLGGQAAVGCAWCGSVMSVTPPR